MGEKTRVSVIIPVFNCEKYLEEAIQSVLDQTLKPYEIIVVDDGSTDSSCEIARSFKPEIIVICKENGGTASAINRGVKEASGDYLAFLDADDIWLPEKLYLQMEVFTQDPSTHAVYCHAVQFISPDLEEEEKAKLECPPEPMSAKTAPAILIKKSAFEQVGHLNESMYIGEFIEWHLRSLELGLNSVVLDTVLLKRRLHTTNKSRVNLLKKRSALLNIARAAVDRKNKNKS